MSTSRSVWPGDQGASVYSLDLGVRALLFDPFDGIVTLLYVYRGSQGAPAWGRCHLSFEEGAAFWSGAFVAPSIVFSKARS